MTLILSSLLVGGCAKTSEYCLIDKPIFFASDKTIDWLVKNDRDVLVGIITNNETYDRLCR